MRKESLTFENLPSAISKLLDKVEKIENYIEGIPQSLTDTILTDTEPLIYGIKGLAEFLQVSTPTAQKIKNSGRVPYSQAERIIIFRKSEVLEALSNKNKKR